MIMLNDFFDFIVVAFVASCWRCSCYCCCHHSVVSALVSPSLICHSAGLFAVFIAAHPIQIFACMHNAIQTIHKMALAQIIRQFVFVLCCVEASMLDHHFFSPSVFARFNSNDLLE